jgi:iron(III) transport system substrate-binding protein
VTRPSLVFPLAAVSVLFVAYWFLWRMPRNSLTVYCAHDAIYAESILRDFERESGIHVAIRFDTEATKSLGLVELLLAEKAAPRCDVFWNNELLGTLDLKEKGLLEAYKGPGYERIPAAFKDPDGCWTGFASRLRVYIVNTKRMAATEDTVRQALSGDLSRVAIAKPLYGTTLTYYTVLWNLWGRDRLIAWHREWRRRGIRELNGNAAVKDAVAEGACDLGFTDTDDFYEAKDDGRPVDFLPVKLENGATICIPNTISIIHGTRHPANAQKLADYLLSEKTELALARSRSRQIPLGPVSEEALPQEVRELRHWSALGVPLAALNKARTECMTWLKEEESK